MKLLSVSSTVSLIFAAIAMTSAESTKSAHSKSTTSSTTTSTSNAPPAQKSPEWLSHVVPLSGNVKSYPSGGNKSIPTGPLPSVTLDISKYPEGWKSPPTTSAEVKAVIAAIDWSMVPDAPVRKSDSNGDLSMTGYDAKDPDCWWSATGCVKSKNASIPEDVAACPNVGDWGLTYDDGPLTADDGGNWAEPRLYDFLAAHNNQKAGLFYIGSNVIAAPAAAQRALADGHTLCVHTWSHPAMTSQTNQQVVAELYWTMRAIKEVTGVTTKCWRPPYGDVDDRVRAIAWQMGLTTVLWDEDTNDWNMPGEGGGNLSPKTVDGYFENWINSRKNGTDNKHGHIVLQHELNNSTVSMAEKWLPKIQQVFNVVPWNQCFNVSNPYWETSFVYPIADGSIPKNASTATPSSSASAAVTPAAPAGTTTDASADKDSAASSNVNSAGAATPSAGSRITATSTVGILGALLFAILY